MKRTGRGERERRRRHSTAAGLVGTLLALVVVLVVEARPSRQAEPVSPVAAPRTPDSVSAAAAKTSVRKARDRQTRRERIDWRHSRAIGTYAAGRLERGVLLPADGREWVSWDPILKRRPSREWRRWGTDRLVRTTLNVSRAFGRHYPAAARLAIGDLSRPHGGDFGPQFGSIGHATHQNGLDVDVYYPRTDRRVRPPARPGQVDLRLAQDLVDRFVAAGAEKVFVGPSLGLEGPSGVVVPLVNHDNHLHARLSL